MAISSKQRSYTWSNNANLTSVCQTCWIWVACIDTRTWALDFCYWGLADSECSLAVKCWAEFAGVWQLALLLWEHVNEANFRLASHASWKFISPRHLEEVENSAVQSVLYICTYSTHTQPLFLIGLEKEVVGVLQSYLEMPGIKLMSFGMPCICSTMELQPFFKYY